MARRRSKPREYHSSLEDAIAAAVMELETLAQEMREWADNIEEKFGGTSKFETISAAADALEECQQPQERTDLDVEVTYHDWTGKRASRADRRDFAVTILDACIEALEDCEQEECLVWTEDGGEALRDELNEMKEKAEEAEFPGMYG